MQVRTYRDDDGSLLNEHIQLSNIESENNVYSKLNTCVISSPSSNLDPTSSPPPVLPSSVLPPSSSPPPLLPIPPSGINKRVSDSFSICKQVPAHAITSILSHHVPLSSVDFEHANCEQFFNHRYHNSEDAIVDFRCWLNSATNTPREQVDHIVRQVKGVWALVDPSMLIFPH